MIFKKYLIYIKIKTSEQLLIVNKSKHIDKIQIDKKPLRVYKTYLKFNSIPVIINYNQSTMDKINSILDKLRFNALDGLPGLAFIQTKYGVRPSLVLLGLLAVLFALSPLFNTYSLLASIICYLIPAYLSFLALESPDKDDDTRFLIYWIIFSLVEVGQPFVRFFLSRFIYMIFRIVLTIALLHPISDLSLKIYNKLISPFLKKHEKEIDDEINTLTEEGKKKVINTIKENLWAWLWPNIAINKNY